MKTTRTSRRTRVVRDKKERIKPDGEQAFRHCEEAAARLKTTSDELSACWTLLGRELATGVSAINLLRQRAWCNVLELRLKERVHALEVARQTMDVAWPDMMATVRSRGLLNRLLRKNSSELAAAHQVWPMLATASAVSKLTTRSSP